jgi:hypothetical protein
LNRRYSPRTSSALSCAGSSKARAALANGERLTVARPRLGVDVAAPKLPFRVAT